MMNKEIEEKLNEMKEDSLVNLLSIFRKGEAFIYIYWDEYHDLRMLSNINSSDKNNIKNMEDILNRFYEIVYTMRHE